MAIGGVVKDELGIGGPVDGKGGDWVVIRSIRYGSTHLDLRYTN